MSRLNITAKIWLSIGVFVLGYVLSTVLGQIERVSTEGNLRVTSEALFPAAQRSQEAEAAFQRMVKALSDAVMTQDASGLDRASEEGRQAVELLKAVAGVSGLAPERSIEAQNLSSSVEQFVGDARNLYGAVLANPANLSADAQGRMRELASRTDTLKASLRAAKDQFSKDLHEQLAAVQRRSAQQRVIALVVFAVTLILAAVIVNVTIRVAITGPVMRVVHGVREASDGAAYASSRVAQSGQIVARDAQEQAACIEETSAALEQISATTRENSARATEADGLMRDGKQTVERAAQAMDELTRSMDVISKSSNQVAAVLKSIDEIAFHTNILALNAAVEAARAGEAGAGFSVVADEVRSLAHRAADAAKRSAEIVEKTIADVGQGVNLVAQAHRAFTQVSAAMVSSSQAVSQIAASSEEQSRGVTHIGKAISRMESVTQNNAANAEQTARDASEMTAQVDATRGHVEELAALIGLHAPDSKSDPQAPTV
jgi:methyl-accepting chemotaxis protein